MLRFVYFRIVRTMVEIDRFCLNYVCVCAGFSLNAVIAMPKQCQKKLMHCELCPSLKCALLIVDMNSSKYDS